VVGPGTLYRHFPSREDLLKAVYQAAAEKLATAATEFAETLPPIDALRAWMMLFVDYIADKQIIAPALNALVDDPHKLYEASYGHATLFLEGQWQLMGALEALNGMLLFGLTTAFLFCHDSEGLAAGKQRAAPGG
jgi:AcrR family transcriptional regulator